MTSQIMKKIITATLLVSTLAAPAFAAGNSGNIGVNVSLDNAIGIQAEFNAKNPVSVQIFLKNYSRNYLYGGPFGSYSYRYTAIGAAGIYDFSKEFRLHNKKIHPYAGLGLYSVSASFNGTGTYVDPSVNGGIYFTAGARYDITPDIDLDGNYNNFGGVTIGANFKF
jgi:hypothetical protein